MSVVILCQATIVHVRELRCHEAIIEQVVNVYLIDVPARIKRALIYSHCSRGVSHRSCPRCRISLTQQRIQIAFLPLETYACAEIMIVILLGAFDALGVQGSLHPGVVEYLWN